jgi:hypothetical protein
METKEPKNIIDFPRISNLEMFESNRVRAEDKNLEHCPCCGKAIPNAKFFVNTIYGGYAYPSIDKTEYNDAWVMGVGSECQKKFPKGYIFTR